MKFLVVYTKLVKYLAEYNLVCFNLNLHVVMINTIMTEIPTIFFILSFLKIIVNSIIIDNTSAAALPRDCGNLWETVRFC